MTNKVAIPVNMEGLPVAVDSQPVRKGSISEASQNSQTAAEFIDSQLRLEADAREALPYAFDHCTQPLGSLRQILFSCLTCNSPPRSPSDPYTAAGICYSCSIACHGEHTLVELFNRRNFTCDCGTTRLPSTSPCTLRINPSTGMKGPVRSEAAVEGNTYNQNFQNRFCGCGEVYDAHAEKGTMFQCLGLATEKDGGCGEDWWHPECLVGPGRRGARSAKAEAKTDEASAEIEKEDNAGVHHEGDAESDVPQVPGFPNEDDFDTFICYKCVDANPWIKRYARTEGFLPPIYKKATKNEKKEQPLSTKAKAPQEPIPLPPSTFPLSTETPNPLKRKADSSPSSPPTPNADPKRSKLSPPPHQPSDNPLVPNQPYHATLPPTPTGTFSLFLHEDFRAHFCRCASCYPSLRAHPQLLEEEESYEAPLSESGDGNGGGESVGTGSLLERGEAALSNMDRVRAIEGVMVYNHLKDKVKSFLQPFAESGQAVGAEDIKAYFEKLRGDEQGIRAAEGGAAAAVADDKGADNRREGEGY